VFLAFPVFLSMVYPTGQLYIPNECNFYRAPYLKEIWVEGITPLVLDAFVVHLWAKPLISDLINITQASGGIVMTTTTITVLAIVTFLVNVATHRHLPDFHRDTNLSESAMFRAVWNFTTAASVTRYIGGVSLMPIVIVTFLPLIYVRVPQSTASVSAIYASMFVVFTIWHTMWQEPEIQTYGDMSATHGVYSIALHWLVFILQTLHHTLWISSHTYTSDTSDDPILCLFFVHWRHSRLPISCFRTLVVLLCVFALDAHIDVTAHGFHKTVKFLQVLFLFATISTYTAWTSCQHTYSTALRNIITASVVASSFGMITQNIEQTAFVFLMFPIAIVIDVVYNTRTDSIKKEN
jgi:hypothetical protein